MKRKVMRSVQTVFLLLLISALPAFAKATTVKLLDAAKDGDIVAGPCFAEFSLLKSFVDWTDNSSLLKDILRLT